MTPETLQAKAEQLQSLCYEPEEWAGYTLCGSSFDQRKAIEFLSTFRNECLEEAVTKLQEPRTVFDSFQIEEDIKAIRSLKTQTEDAKDE